MNPKISVIIPIYNGEIYVERVIKSVLSQTIQNFEIIFIDDGSIDNSISQIKKFNDERIRIYSIKHRGVSAARNKGVDMARSNFIAFLDVDDEWRPIFIETMLKMREKYPEAGIYIVNRIIKEDYNIDINKIKVINDDVLITNFFSIYLKNSHFISTSAVALDKKIYNELNGFDEKVVWGEDEDLWSRIALNYPVAYSNNICTIAYKQKDRHKKINLRLRITKEHPFIKNGKKAIKMINMSKDNKDDLIKYVSKLELVSIKNNIIIGDFEYAQKLLNNTDNKYFKMQKIYLQFWVSFSCLIGKKSGQTIFNYHLLILRKFSEKLDQYAHIKLKDPITTGA
jgi:glycosyltransferase involved in cell wall biosynthesis